jgi:hypothetical protein
MFELSIKLSLSNRQVQVLLTLLMLLLRQYYPGGESRRAFLYRERRASASAARIARCAACTHARENVLTR